MTFNLTIDMDTRCAECGKPGASGSGICLGCATKAMGGKPMRSAQGQAVQRRWMEGCKSLMSWQAPTPPVLARRFGQD